MSCQANYFCPIKSGTTFPRKKITRYNGIGEDKTPFDLTDWDITFEFKTSPNANDVAFQFSTLDETITIEDPLTGSFFLESRLITYKPMEYYYDVYFIKGAIKKFAFSNKWIIT